MRISMEAWVGRMFIVLIANRDVHHAEDHIISNGIRLWDIIRSFLNGLAELRISGKQPANRTKTLTGGGLYE